ncbi:MAG: hypothetical protein HQ548_04820 [Chloroflexi bacterium]|nr:hypothetical protein [Chloroflexota bacterium]
MSKLSWSCRVAAVAMAVLVLVAMSGCGSEDTGESGAPAAEESASQGIQKIRPGSQVYVVEDLTSLGFKKAKTYNVEGLPEAVAAYYGFWGLDPYKRADYEVRFYASHEDAVEYGTALVEERIGREAKLTVETATWGEGVKDARECISAGGSSSQHASTCLEPKYFDYVIAANMVLLCQGRDSLGSLETCDELLAEMAK